MACTERNHEINYRNLHFRDHTPVFLHFVEVHQCNRNKTFTRVRSAPARRRAQFANADRHADGGPPPPPRGSPSPLRAAIVLRDEHSRADGGRLEVRSELARGTFFLSSSLPVVISSPLTRRGDFPARLARRRCSVSTARRSRPSPLCRRTPPTARTSPASPSTASRSSRARRTSPPSRRSSPSGRWRRSSSRRRMSSSSFRTWRSGSHGRFRMGSGRRRSRSSTEILGRQ